MMKKYIVFFIAFSCLFSVANGQKYNENEILKEINKKFISYLRNIKKFNHEEPLQEGDTKKINKIIGEFRALFNNDLAAVKVYNDLLDLGYNIPEVAEIYFGFLGGLKKMQLEVDQLLLYDRPQRIDGNFKIKNIGYLEKLVAQKEPESNSGQPIIYRYVNAYYKREIKAIQFHQSEQDYKEEDRIVICWEVKLERKKKEYKIAKNGIKIIGTISYNDYRNNSDNGGQFKKKFSMPKTIFGRTLRGKKPKSLDKGEKIDSDSDGIQDYLDECPDVKGIRTRDWKDCHGCPDTDKDKVPDKCDKCPEVAGVTFESEKFKPYSGCPDTDGDGVPDEIDKCPESKGINKGDNIENCLGCPDNDGDQLPNGCDQCPDSTGVLYTNKEYQTWNGCPDRDQDGIPDAKDNCPNEVGTKANDGCPPAESEEKLVFDAVRTQAPRLFNTFENSIKLNGDSIPENASEELISIFEKKGADTIKIINCKTGKITNRTIQTYPAHLKDLGYQFIQLEPAFTHFSDNLHYDSLRGAWVDTLFFQQEFKGLNKNKKLLYYDLTIKKILLITKIDQKTINVQFGDIWIESVECLQEEDNRTDTSTSSMKMPLHPSKKALIMQKPQNKAVPIVRSD